MKPLAHVAERLPGGDDAIRLAVTGIAVALYARHEHNRRVREAVLSPLELAPDTTSDRFVSYPEDYLEGTGQVWRMTEPLN